MKCLIKNSNELIFKKFNKIQENIHELLNEIMKAMMDMNEKFNRDRHFFQKNQSDLRNGEYNKSDKIVS
jgi:hypothetical protein